MTATTGHTACCVLHDLDDSCAGQVHGLDDVNGDFVGAFNWCAADARDLIVVELPGDASNSVRAEIRPQQALALIGHLSSALAERTLRVGRETSPAGDRDDRQIHRQDKERHLDDHDAPTWRTTPGPSA